MSARTIEVRIAGKAITAPICGDEKMTAEVVEAVNAKIKEIESASTRIDTQAYALQAAYAFASQLALERADRRGEEETLLSTLDQIQSTLSRLTKQSRSLVE